MIAPDIVLTAAHCDNAERVWIGVYSQSEEFDTRHENIEIEQQIQHPLRRTISDQDHGKENIFGTTTRTDQDSFRTTL